MQLSEVENRIIECLKSVQPKDLSINEIAKLARISRLTASKYIAVLCARGLIVSSRVVGRAKMFQLSPDYAKKATLTSEIKAKRMIKIEFLKNYLHYKKGAIVSLEENEARELIKTQFAREL